MQQFDKDTLYGAGVLTRNRGTVQVFVKFNGEMLACELTSKFGNTAKVRNAAGRPAEVSVANLYIEEAEAARCLEAGQKKAQAIEEVARWTRINGPRRNFQTGQYLPHAGR